jgi:hypothetical protein
MSIVTCTHREKDVLRIALSLINSFHFDSKEKRKEEKKSQMTIHLSFIDNRDVTTTTTFDTSNNTYQMVRKKYFV